MSDRENQLTERWLAKIVDKVIKEVQKCSSLEAAEKHIYAEIFKKYMHTSVKILQIFMDLKNSVQRSSQNPAKEILEICIDSQRSKTWEFCHFPPIKSFSATRIQLANSAHFWRWQKTAFSDLQAYFAVRFTFRSDGTRISISEF